MEHGRAGYPETGTNRSFYGAIIGALKLHWIPKIHSSIISSIISGQPAGKRHIQEGLEEYNRHKKTLHSL
jgi:hypothetical protein